MQFLLNYLPVFVDTARLFLKINKLAKEQNGNCYKEKKQFLFHKAP